MHLRFLAAALAVLLTLTHAPAQERKNTELILVESRIEAANGHYKSVLIQIADKKTAARLAKDRAELKQLQSDLAVLEDDRKATEEQIASLVKDYNAMVKRQR